MTDTRARARALREVLMRNMEGRRNYTRQYIEDAVRAEWDAEWDTIIAAALAVAERQGMERAAKVQEAPHGTDAE